MRVLVLFDLPTGTKAERKQASQFRNFLVGDGFDMLQFSVYSRLCPNRDVAMKWTGYTNLDNFFRSFLLSYSSNSMEGIILVWLNQTA